MRRALAPAAVVFTAATLAACGGGGADGTTAASSPATTASTPTTATTATTGKATTTAGKTAAKKDRADRKHKAATDGKKAKDQPSSHTDTAPTKTTSSPASGTPSDSRGLGPYRASLSKVCTRFKKQVAGLSKPGQGSGQAQVVERLGKLRELGKAEVRALRRVQAPANTPGTYARAIGILERQYGKLGAVVKAAADQAKDPNALVQALQSFAKTAAQGVKAFDRLKLPDCSAAGATVPK